MGGGVRAVWEQQNMLKNVIGGRRGEVAHAGRARGGGALVPSFGLP